MLLYNSIGPNPRVVRIFMAERGIELPRVEVDLRGGENRGEPYLAKNPTGQCPALELDDGTVIAEITAICEYLDEVTPGPSLIGSTPQERAETRMWARRIDLNILEPMANGFRYSDGLKMFQNRIHCIPAAADDLKQIAQEQLTWLDGQMGGKHVHLRRPADAGGYSAVRVRRFLRWRASADQPGEQEHRRLACADEGASQRRGIAEKTSRRTGVRASKLSCVAQGRGRCVRAQRRRSSRRVRTSLAAESRRCARHDRGRHRPSRCRSTEALALSICAMASLSSLISGARMISRN